MPTSPDIHPGARALVLLITPTDRHRDARRLTDAGFRIIATSRAESSVRQIVAAGSALVAIELVPTLSDEIVPFVDLLLRSGRQARNTPLLVYGPAANAAAHRDIARMGVAWVEVSPTSREALVDAVRGALGG